MDATHALLIEKISRLPPERLAELEDFVDFLTARAAARPPEPPFAELWGDPDGAGS